MFLRIENAIRTYEPIRCTPKSLRERQQNIPKNVSELTNLVLICRFFEASINRRNRRGLEHARIIMRIYDDWKRTNKENIAAYFNP
jgi:hypothetical protein